MVHKIESLERLIEAVSDKIVTEKKLMDEAVALFASTPTYTVKDNGGSIATYKYFLYPFKGYSLVRRDLYQYLARTLARMVPKETEVIVTIEADGIELAGFIAAELGLPLIICKSYHYNVECVSFTQLAGYHKRTMYMPQVIAGKKVALVDCMISTGGTIKAMINAIKALPQTEIAGIYCLNNKDNYRPTTNLFDGYEYKYILDTTINKEDKVVAVPSKHYEAKFRQYVDRKYYEVTELCAEQSNTSRHGYQVGSLVVDSATLDAVAWGYRRGKIHAEQDTINMLKTNVPNWAEKKFILYTTMEPCIYRNDSGHRPCANILSDLPQIERVVIGHKDDFDEKINGLGIAHLQEHHKIVSMASAMAGLGG